MTLTELDQWIAQCDAEGDDTIRIVLYLGAQAHADAWGLICAVNDALGREGCVGLSTTAGYWDISGTTDDGRQIHVYVNREVNL